MSRKRKHKSVVIEYVVGVDLTGTPIVCRHYIVHGGRV